MAIKDRVPLRDHFLQITPGFAQGALDKLDTIMRGAGVASQPSGTQPELSEMGVVLQPLLSRWLDMEVEDEATAGLLKRANRLGDSQGNLQWAILELSTTTWALRRPDAERDKLRDEFHALIMGLYQAGRERLHEAMAGEIRDRYIIANLANGIELAVHSDIYLQAASKGALSDMRLFEPRGRSRVDFDAHYPLILEILDALIKVQAQPYTLLKVEV